MDIPAAFPIASISSLGFFLWSGGEVLRGITGLFVLNSVKEQKLCAEQQRVQREQLCLPSSKDGYQGARDKSSLGCDGCTHAQEHTAAVRGVALAEEQIRAGSTNIGGTAGRGAQPPLKMAASAPSMRETGEKRWQMAWIKCKLSLLAVEHPRPLCWAHHTGQSSRANNSVWSEVGSPRAAELGHPGHCSTRAKPSWCRLQIRIPNAKSCIRQLQK